MAQRGGVHTYHPKWTVVDKATGKRRLVTGKGWAWRFRHHGRRYSGGGGLKQGEAQRAGEKRQAEVRGGMEQDPRKTTFETLERILTAEYSVKEESTQQSMRTALNRLRPFFQNMRACDITRTTALEYVAYRQRTAQARNTTINLDITYLRRAMNLAHEQGRLLGVPRFPRLKHARRHEFFRPDELERILAELPAWWRPFYQVADEVGWRARSELKTRRWIDVDLDAGFLWLDAQSTKTDKARAFPITVHLRELLEGQRERVRAIEAATGQIIPWVFCRKDGRPLGDTRKAWQSACRRAGFGKLPGRTGPWSSAKVPHDLRRTALMRWELIGVARNASMAAAGHDEERTFSGYAGATPEALRRMGEQLDAHRQEQEGRSPKVVPIRTAGEG